MSKLSDTIGQFVTIPFSFIESMKDLSCTSVTLFLLLRYFTNHNTGDAFPSYETIQEMTGMHPRTIVKAIRELEVAGWIDIKKRFGKSTIYTIKLPSQKVDDSPSTVGRTEAKSDAAISNTVGTTEQKSDAASSSTVGSNSSSNGGRLTRLNELDHIVPSSDSVSRFARNGSNESMPENASDITSSPIEFNFEEEKAQPIATTRPAEHNDNSHKDEDPVARVLRRTIKPPPCLNTQIIKAVQKTVEEMGFCFSRRDSDAAFKELEELEPKATPEEVVEVLREVCGQWPKEKKHWVHFSQVPSWIRTCRARVKRGLMLSISIPKQPEDEGYIITNERGNRVWFPGRPPSGNTAAIR